jgi:hypothetical protein
MAITNWYPSVPYFIDFSQGAYTNVARKYSHAFCEVRWRDWEKKNRMIFHHPVISYSFQWTLLLDPWMTSVRNFPRMSSDRWHNETTFSSSNKSKFFLSSCDFSAYTFLCYYILQMLSLPKEQTFCYHGHFLLLFWKTLSLL